MSKVKNGVSILGSTGSIGRQTLEVTEHLNIKIRALSVFNNIDLLERQILKYSPELAAVYDKEAAQELKKRLSGVNTRITQGMDGLIEAALDSRADIIVTAISGEVGLEPTLAALRTGKRVAIANKEPLVCAGGLVMKTAREYGAEIIPVDSEHSAIFQCLTEIRLRKDGIKKLSKLQSPQIKKIILTASGGPFRGLTHDELKKITPEQALKHPNWDMGKKITIDSATLMNKGLELIEAIHLFGLTPDQIEVVIHPESIIHSMVEFADGSTIAQLSSPDMRQPIQYALTYPNRQPSLTKPLDLTQIGQLTFEKPDHDTFPCLRLAFEAAKKGDAACAALNKANEEAVNLFLNNKISFTEIPEIIEVALKTHSI
jgi:1-deoxy-D-xylulose-5-phosphate reductoisomerase